MWLDVEHVPLYVRGPTFNSSAPVREEGRDSIVCLPDSDYRHMFYAQIHFHCSGVLTIPKCPTIGTQLHNLQHIHIMEYQSFPVILM